MTIFQLSASYSVWLPAALSVPSQQQKRPVRQKCASAVSVYGTGYNPLCCVLSDTPEGGLRAESGVRKTQKMFALVDLN